LWNALKKQAFPILDLPGRVQLALGGAKDGAQKKMRCGGAKAGG
jgi:hypothetical protein